MQDASVTDVIVPLADANTVIVHAAVVPATNDRFSDY